MIIFGISTKEAAKPAGRFHCPVCGAERTYAQLVRKRRFTLFFLPVLPLGKSSLGRVRCTNCGSEFNERAVAS
jgi:transcription elongation factor Elf1